MNIATVVSGIISTNHDGNEKKLQKAVAKALLATAPEFSPTHKFSDFNKNLVTGTGIGTELGFNLSATISPDIKYKNRYVDIAEVGNVINTNNFQIKWLCEIKVFNPAPENNNVAGHYYPWIYKYDDKNPTPQNINLLQVNCAGYFITNADEGQLFFDLTKMLAAVSLTSYLGTSIPLYQIIAIKTQAPQLASPASYIISEEYVINSLRRMFCVFNHNVNKFEVRDYTSSGTVLVSAPHYAVTGSVVDSCTIYDYHHIIIKWEYTVAPSSYVRLD